MIPERHGKETTAFAVLAAISFSHLLNDTIQSLIPALYPILKSSFALNFSQVGLLTLTLMLTASLLQPVVGLYTDRRPAPYSLVVGMGFSLVGLLLLSVAGTFAWLLVAAGLVGIGSSVFHPESSRMARMASGGPPRSGAVAVPGRWERRVVIRPAAGGVPGRSTRPVEHRVVLARGPARDGRAVEDRQLAQRAAVAKSPAARSGGIHGAGASRDFARGASPGRSRSWPR